MEALLALVAGATSDGGAAVPFIEGLLTAGDPSTTAVWVPGALEFVAVIAGAVSGALTAYEKRLDILGVCVLALITSLGGGLIRDMILSNGSVYILNHPGAVIGCLVVGVVAFFFAGLLYRINKVVAVFDIVSVALFTFSGADKTLLAGYGFVACVLMGVLTGVGGGMCRDICLGRIPNIFKSSNFYAVCSLAGAVVYLVLVECHVAKIVAATACIAVVLGLRWVSLRYDLITAVPVDLTPKLVGPLSRLRHRSKRKVSGPYKSPDTNASQDGDPTPAHAEPREKLHILVQRRRHEPQQAMESWSDTPERRALEERKEREFRGEDADDGSE